MRLKERAKERWTKDISMKDEFYALYLKRRRSHGLIGTKPPLFYYDEGGYDNLDECPSVCLILKHSSRK